MHLNENRRNRNVDEWQNKCNILNYASTENVSRLCFLAFVFNMQTTDQETAALVLLAVTFLLL